MYNIQKTIKSTLIQNSSPPWQPNLA